MKTCLLFIIVMLASALVADSGKSTVSADERAARKVKFYEIQMRKNGGIVIKPGSQQGQFLIVYENGKINPKIVEAAAEKIRKGYRIAIQTKPDDPVSINNVESIIKKIEANLILFVISDNNSSTTMLIAPENKWAILNAAPLYKEVSNEISLQRLEKEIMRSFAILSGSFSSQFPNSIAIP